MPVPASLLETQACTSLRGDDASIGYPEWELPGICRRQLVIAVNVSPCRGRTRDTRNGTRVLEAAPASPDRGPPNPAVAQPGVSRPCWHLGTIDADKTSFRLAATRVAAPRQRPRHTNALTAARANNRKTMGLFPPLLVGSTLRIRARLHARITSPRSKRTADHGYDKIQVIQATIEPESQSSCLLCANGTAWDLTTKPGKMEQRDSQWRRHPVAARCLSTARNV